MIYQTIIFFQVKQYRRNLQAERETEYQEALVTIEDQLRKQNEVRLKEQIGEELRRYTWEYYERTGKLPELPSAESGGSRAMFSRQGDISNLIDKVTSKMFFFM